MTLGGADMEMGHAVAETGDMEEGQSHEVAVIWSECERRDLLDVGAEHVAGD